MSAISFQRQFLDALLSRAKQQTTRKQTDRIKVGATAQIYIEQRAELTGKPVRVMTGAGTTAIADRANDAQYTYPAECPPSTFLDKFEPVYYAHILGEVHITSVYDFVPACSSTPDIWARNDGFKDFAAADEWFTNQYSDEWTSRAWTVIRWAGWTARYFEPKP